MELAGRPATVVNVARAARALARAKARSVARRADNSAALVLAADTVVLAGGRILGKPRDAAEARAMLEHLRGRRHHVLTALALRTAKREHSGSATTAVYLRRYSQGESDAYIARGEPYDKAGAYAIQDALFRPVARIAGCYTNVVGLPLCLTTDLLARAGLPARVPPDAPVLGGCTACPLRVPNEG
jgi:MAF protein